MNSNSTKQGSDRVSQQSPLTSDPRRMRIIQLETEISATKIQVRNKQNQWIKQRAIFEQKLELYQLQIKQGQEREENLKKMNETFLQTLNDIVGDPKTFTNKGIKELQQTLENHSKEIITQKNKSQQAIKNLENHVRELKLNNQQKDIKIKQLQLIHEQQNSDIKNTIKDLIRDQNELEEKLKRSSEDRKLLKDFNESELIHRNSQLALTIDALKKEHTHEIESFKKQAQISIAQIKEIYEKEREQLYFQKQQMDIMNEENQNEKFHGHADLEFYEKEMAKLNERFQTSLKRHYQEESNLQKEKEIIEKQFNQLDSNHQKLQSKYQNDKNLYEQNLKILKEKLQKQKVEIQQFNQNEESNQKLKLKVQSLKEQLVKLQQSERRLQDLVIEKEQSLEEEQMENSRKEMKIKSINNDKSMIFNQTSMNEERFLEGNSINDFKSFIPSQRGPNGHNGANENRPLSSNKLDLVNNYVIASQRKQIQPGQIVRRSSTITQGPNGIRGPNDSSQNSYFNHSTNNVSEQSNRSLVVAQSTNDLPHHLIGQDQGGSSAYATNSMDYSTINRKLSFPSQNNIQGYMSLGPQLNLSNTNLPIPSGAESNSNFNTFQQVQNSQQPHNNLNSNALNLNNISNSGPLNRTATSNSSGNENAMVCELCNQWIVAQTYISHLKYCQNRFAHPLNMIQQNQNLNQQQQQQIYQNSQLNHQYQLQQSNSQIGNMRGGQLNENQNFGYPSSNMSQSELSGFSAALGQQNRINVLKHLEENRDSLFFQTMNGSENMLSKIIDECNIEKMELEEAIKTLTQSLQEKTKQMKSIEQENQILKQSLELAQTDLNNTIIEKQVLEQKREESQTALKNQIKYLVDKLLKAKQKLQSNAAQENADNSSSANIQAVTPNSTIGQIGTNYQGGGFPHSGYVETPKTNNNINNNNGAPNSSSSVLKSSSFHINSSGCGGNNSNNLFTKFQKIHKDQFYNEDEGEDEYAHQSDLPSQPYCESCCSRKNSSGNQQIQHQNQRQNQNQNCQNCFEALNTQKTGNSVKKDYSVQRSTVLEMLNRNSFMNNSCSVVNSSITAGNCNNNNNFNKGNGGAQYHNSSLNSKNQLSNEGSTNGFSSIFNGHPANNQKHLSGFINFINQNQQNSSFGAKSQTNGNGIDQMFSDKQYLNVSMNSQNGPGQSQRYLQNQCEKSVDQFRAKTPFSSSSRNSGFKSMGQSKYDMSRQSCFLQ